MILEVLSDFWEAVQTKYFWRPILYVISAVILGYFLFNVIGIKLFLYTLLGMSALGLLVFVGVVNYNLHMDEVKDNYHRLTGEQWENDKF